MSSSLESSVAEMCDDEGCGDDFSAIAFCCNGDRLIDFAAGI